MEDALLVIAIVEALAIIGLTCFIVLNNRSYHKIVKKAELIASGKLDVEDIHFKDKQNNSTIIASAFNSIKSNLLTFVETTKSNVTTLSDAINVLSKSINANQMGNEQIADGVSTVAVKTAEQLELVKKNLSIIEANNRQMQEIDESMTHIKYVLDETVEISKHGINNLNDYEKDMHAITMELANSNQILTKFNDEIKRISEVGEFIIAISEQLKLLALNASIEAARAGQSGRGFAVVVDEMNDMSGKTKEGMVTINQILGEVIQSSQQVNESIKNCELTFNQSKQTFEDVNSSFQSINQQAFDIHDSMKEITDKFDTIAQNSVQTKNMASDLFEASQLISSSTHEMAAASQETAAESSQIGENVEALGEMLTDIQKLLRQFNTSVTPVNRQPAKPLKIAFIGMLDNDFWYGVRRGVYYSANELSDKNVVVDYTGYTDNGAIMDQKLVAKVKQCIEDNYDGIILPGFLGAADEYLNEAIARGTKVMAFNCDCSAKLRKLACFSPDAYEAGTMAGKCMTKALNKRGNIIIIAGDLKVRVNEQRVESFKKEVSTCKNIHILDTLVVEDNPDKVYNIALECLRTRNDVDAIYITSGMSPSVAKAIIDSGKEGKVVSVGFDHNEEIFNYIKRGIIVGAIGQDPFGQGHDPVIWMYNHLVTGEPLPSQYMPCRLSVVDKSNVDSLIA